MEAPTTKIMVNKKCIHNLVKLVSPLRRSKTPGTVEVDGAEMKETDERRTTYRSAAGTLRYMAGDRPDIQFQVKERCRTLQRKHG